MIYFPKCIIYYLDWLTNFSLKGYAAQSKSQKHLYGDKIFRLERRNLRKMFLKVPPSLYMYQFIGSPNVT